MDKTGVFLHIIGRRCQRIIMGGGELVSHRLFNGAFLSVWLSPLLVIYSSAISMMQLAKYFTAYRIDHILGFFRIWELPEHAATGLVGKFRPSIPLSQVCFLSIKTNSKRLDTSRIVYLTCS
jgi:hypothetical protein